MEQYNRTNPIVVVIAVVAGIVIGYFIGTFTADTQMGTAVQETGEQAEQNLNEINFRSDSDINEDDMNADATLTEAEANETAFVVAMDRLSDTQQVAVRAAGVEGDEIVITRGMVVCAESEMGSSRVAEIEGGASISMSEGVTLISCYNSN